MKQREVIRNIHLLFIILIRSFFGYGQEIVYDRIPSIKESNFKSELRISYEGIIGSILIIRLDSLYNISAVLSEYSLRYNYYKHRNNDYSKDKFIRMDFNVDNRSIQKYYVLNYKELVHIDSIDCYSSGFDGNTLSIEWKIENEVFQEEYWESESSNKDCLLKYNIDKYYMLLMDVRKELNSNGIYISSLKKGIYGNYGESCLHKK
jgi:hypothetical protein